MGSWDGEVAGVYVPILVKRLVDGIRKQSSEFGLWRVDTVPAGDLEGLIVHVTWGRHFIIFAGENAPRLKTPEKAFDWPRLKAGVAAAWNQRAASAASLCKHV